MHSKEQIQATIAALKKLRDCDAVTISDLKNDYGPLWASVFDELQARSVVDPPHDGPIRVHRAYIEPALEYFKERLAGYKREKWIDRRSWIALIMSTVTLLWNIIEKLWKLLH